jgi:mRNA-degrading endonuclease RelE of RelBE toxin-antitoxin system
MDYRILCRIEHHRLVVVVISVGHRSGVYED